MYTLVPALKTLARPSLLPSLILVAVLTVAVTVVLLRDTKPAYADQLRTICHDAYESMATTSGNYFENVVTVSSLKHQGLMRLKPPADHAAFHRGLVRREWTMFENAAAAQDRVAQAQAVQGVAGPVAMAEFPILRAAQAELDGWYRQVGVEHCSD